MFSSSKKQSIRRLGYLLCVTYILALVLVIVATLVIIAKFPKTTISTTTETTTIATTATTAITATTTTASATTTTTSETTTTTSTNTTTTSETTTTTTSTSTTTTSTNTTTASATTTTTTSTSTTTTSTSTTTTSTSTTTTSTSTTTTSTSTTTTSTSTTTTSTSTTTTSTSTTTTSTSTTTTSATTTTTTSTSTTTTSTSTTTTSTSTTTTSATTTTTTSTSTTTTSTSTTTTSTSTTTTSTSTTTTSTSTTTTSATTTTTTSTSTTTTSTSTTTTSTSTTTTSTSTTTTSATTTTTTSTSTTTTSTSTTTTSETTTTTSETTTTTSDTTTTTTSETTTTSSTSSTSSTTSTSTTTTTTTTACSPMFLAQTTYSTGAGSDPTSVAVADVNNDNKPDIVVAEFNSNNVGVFLNTGSGTFLAQTTYSPGAGSSPRAVAVVDVNNDNNLDIVVAAYGSNSVDVFLNAGNGTFLAQTTYSTGAGSNPRAIAVVDVNSDNNPDIVVGDDNSNSVGVFLNAGNGTFLAQTSYSTGAGSNPSSVAVVDVNSDNKPDIVVACYTSSNVGVLLNAGNGTFLAQTTYSTGAGSNPRGVAVVDVNSDNNPDIIVSEYSSSNVGVFLNAGNGTFLPQTTYSTGAGSNPYSVAVVDVNSDSKPDIVVSEYGSNNIGVFLNAGNGTFLAQTTYSTGAGSTPFGLAVVDVNSDSKPDIVVTDYGSNNVGILLHC